MKEELNQGGTEVVRNCSKTNRQINGLVVASPPKHTTNLSIEEGFISFTPNLSLERNGNLSSSCFYSSTRTRGHGILCRQDWLQSLNTESDGYMPSLLQILQPEQLQQGVIF